MVKAFVSFIAISLASVALAAPALRAIPAFDATSLTGAAVSSAQLIGQPTVLIVTPSKGAAGDTRAWAHALRRSLDSQAVRVRDVLAIDLPFFMSETDALGRAKEKIPARYYDQTWLTSQTKLETALGIPTDSNQAFVFVLNSQGEIVVRVSGEPTPKRLGEVESALQSLNAETIQGG